MDQVRAQAGKVYYDKYCTPCHGAGGAPGSAVYSKSQKPVDLRQYVALHGGKFPVGQWLELVSVDRPGAVHSETWRRIRDDQQLGAGGVSAETVGRGVVANIAAYVRSVQAK